MTDEELIAYYSTGIPVDEELLAPLGLVTWAAARLHSGVRDSLGLDFGDGLSDEPFNDTLGTVIRKLVNDAASAGEPWATEVADWAEQYGWPACKERDSIVHAVAHTAADGKQAIMRPRRHGGGRLLTPDLEHAAGHLTLASVRLGEALERCRQARTA